jgi:hypothetical protein
MSSTGHYCRSLIPNVSSTTSRRGYKAIVLTAEDEDLRAGMVMMHFRQVLLARERERSGTHSLCPAICLLNRMLS